MTVKDISNFSFEQAMSELEDVVAKLENGQVPLEDSIKLYEMGNDLKKHCEQKLKEAEERIVDNKPDSEKELIEMTEMINKAKNTCRSLGFEEGTDKFTDCSLKLYTQDVDNKVALKVSKQKSVSSNSGVMTIYDPVRDRQNQIDRGMKMLSGGCTLGVDC